MAPKQSNKSPLSVSVALTVTLSKYIKGFPAEKQDLLCRERILEIFQKYKAKATCVIELTQNFDAHYHAIVSVPLNILAKQNVYKLVTDMFRGDKHFGFTCVKPILSEEGWCKYLLKDFEVTKGLGFYPFVCDNYNLWKDLPGINPPEKIDVNEYVPIIDSEDDE
jgi:hypothetical protein